MPDDRDDAIMLAAEAVRPAAMTLFRTDDPQEIIVRATSVANALAGAVRKQGLALNIQGKEYVKVEGWTLLGTLLGVFPVVVSSEAVPGSERECQRTEYQKNGPPLLVPFTGRDWSARVEARDKSGAVVGAAVSVCSRSEKRWQDADDYAVNSMAQTRATSKALRLPLGFVMSLAGFEATPADEVPEGGFHAPQPRQERTKPAGDSQRTGGRQPRLCPLCGATAVFVDREGVKLYCWDKWKKDPGCGAKWRDEEHFRGDQPPPVSAPLGGEPASGGTFLDGTDGLPANDPDALPF